jgi:hypothetical protein
MIHVLSAFLNPVAPERVPANYLCEPKNLENLFDLETKTKRQNKEKPLLCRRKVLNLCEVGTPQLIQRWATR